MITVHSKFQTVRQMTQDCRPPQQIFHIHRTLAYVNTSVDNLPRIKNSSTSRKSRETFTTGGVTSRVRMTDGRGASWTRKTGKR